MVPDRDSASPQRLQDLWRAAGLTVSRGHHLQEQAYPGHVVERYGR